MSLIIASKKSNQQEWIKALNALDPDLSVEVYPNYSSKDKVEIVMAWHPPLGVFKEFPNLKWIASTGAGVDHILKDPDIPKEVIVTRIVDERLTKDMTSYLTAQVMCHVRNVSEYSYYQARNEWHPIPYKHESDVRIGIMGIGELGRSAAQQLLQLGFQVHGWARSKKSIEEIRVFSGDDEFSNFLNTSDILICLLPLTRATYNILNKKTFEQLPKNAFIINVARGEHLVVQDLVDALDSNHLSGACLDVFREEPLPTYHVFWTHPKIKITPHIASITSPASVAPQIISNYRRLMNGEELENVVEKEKGY